MSAIGRRRITVNCLNGSEAADLLEAMPSFHTAYYANLPTSAWRPISVIPRTFAMSKSRHWRPS